MTDPALRRLLDQTGPLLLDFDGPVCSVFARYPAADLAATLRQKLAQRGIETPAELAQVRDPLEVLRWTGRLGRPSLTRAIDDELTAAELAAVGTSAPTLYSREVIVAAAQGGRRVTVVTNNSAEAVTAYLTAHRLSVHVAHVVGRAHGHPERMKPNPEPIRNAVAALGADPSACLLVGDSASDIEGAQAAGVRSIGYVNNPAKRDRLSTAGPDFLLDNMAELAIALIEIEPAFVAELQT
jgi:phosphoglycolate phosphatase-like HAD superfamily hydrolase